jgi:hypothetical protein
LPTLDNAIQRAPTRTARLVSVAVMDACGLGKALRNCGQQAAESPPAVAGNTAKNGARRGGSSIGATSSTEVVTRFFNQPIQPASRNICLKLPIPLGAVKLCEPRPECGSLFGRQLPHSGLNLLHSAHTVNLSQHSALINATRWSGNVPQGPPRPRAGVRAAVQDKLAVDKDVLDPVVVPERLGVGGVVDHLGRIEQA